MSVPEEIERLERTVQEAEEKERRLVSAQNYVDQSRYGLPLEAFLAL